MVLLYFFLIFRQEAVTSPIVHLTFERGGYCSLANYTLMEDGKIKVQNYQRLKSKTGPSDFIEGYAYTPDPNEPGKLKVNLGFGGKYSKE